jgi:hypothetical protein
LTPRSLGDKQTAMTKGPKDEKSQPKGDPREARLAKALRDNLRRRKTGPGESAAVVNSDKSAR